LTGQRLHQPIVCYRIGDPEGDHPIFDAEGSRLWPGRWNTSAVPLIYASEHYSTAMLEKLANGNGRLPPRQHFIEITLPNGLSYEVVTKDSLPGWHEPDFAASRSFAGRWVAEARSAVLFVPSVVARMERNILINPAHPEFRQITHGLHLPVWWDRRLFSP